MATNYKLRIRDDTGSQTEEFGIGMPDPSGDYVAPFHYTKGVFDPGMLRFRLSGNHPAIDSLSRNAQVEVWRKVDANDWYRDFLGVYLEDYDYIYRDELDFVAMVPGIRTLLQWAINAWYAGTSGKTTFSGVAGETVGKDIAKFNIDATNATTGNGRLLDWQSPFTFVIETDGGGGNTISWNNAWDNVFSTLDELQNIAGGAFDLVRDPDDDGSYTKFEVQWFGGQRGRDLTSTVILAVKYGNLENVRYQHRGSQIKTAAVVGGQGKKSNRDVEVRTSSLDGANIHREAFVNATNVDKGDTSALQDRGDSYLENNRDIEKLTFDILQTEGTKYGVDYAINSAGDLGVLGDLVTVIRPHDRQSQTHKLVKATVNVDADGEETIRVETEKQ